MASVYTALSLLLTILLFSTGRRGNGWTGVHELLSRTRVVQRNVRPVASAAPKASPADLVPTLSSLRRVGPYAVHTMVGETGGGRLFVGVDPILRRHVWIHEVAPGTPPVDATRRDVSRPGRLYWLAGRRSATENWDAFEAPRGEPFLTAPPTSDWRQAHRALSSLAIELDASAREASINEARDTRLSLAHVWRRADGQLVLLDFSWPAPVAPDANQTLSPVELLAAVSTRALAPVAEPAAPLSATTLLHRLTSRSPPALADVKAELVRLGSIPSRPSRGRRALPMVMAAMPACRTSPDRHRDASHGREIHPGERSVIGSTQTFVRWMTWITDSSADAELKTQEQRTAAEQYVAAHFGPQLTSDGFWAQTPQFEPFLGMRRTAAEIAARYPAVSPDELARASAIVAPQIQELADERAKPCRKLPRRCRGAPRSCRQRVRIHSGVVLDRVRSDIGAGRARRSGHAGSPACGGEARWPRDWPGAIGDPVPGRLVAGARVDRLCRSSDVRRAACVSGRGVHRGQSRVPVDGGRRRVDHREFPAADRTTTSPARGLCQGRCTRARAVGPVATVDQA